MADEANGGAPAQGGGAGKKILKAMVAGVVLLFVALGIAVMVNPSGLADMLEGLGDSAKTASDTVRPE